ncbi:hypothetical protein RDV89_06845 [Nocardioides zeae]|uniref:Uncharacterized protein n=1 Tax=Nocardioides imazamoxiresistens TaxID=3231893 RepID=A0ABU3PU74_9ACTN|nr:hypothetical protein [Nocardioides zeae]MDT9592777.1 hypothetical protein [Nocardioides zeae]
MADTEAFDAFYKDARGRLLLQTYLLTGDLPVARSAVREAFTIAWHHWSKVGARPDPLPEVRTRAWAIAQRRSTARPWHREKGIDPEVARTLEVLDDLDGTPRRLLVLSETEGTALAEASRELGVTVEDGARHLAVGRAEYALQRGLETPEAVDASFAAVAASLGDVRWPRPSILRRAGTRRRRVHTVVGVATAVAAVVASGAVVHDDSGTATSLARSVEREGAPATPTPEPPPSTFGTDMLLDAQQVGSVTGTGWSAEVDDNTSGDGLVVPCQQSRYADVEGLAGYVSTFTPTGEQGEQGGQEGQQDAGQRVLQINELSRQAEEADATFDTWRGWFAGCSVPRTQLVGTYDVTGVGDEAAAFVLSTAGDPGTLLTAGVARTGDVTTVVAYDGVGAAQDSREGVVQLLAGAVDRLCAADDSRTCATTAEARSRLPFPVGETPQMLDVIDLPPLGSVDQPWTATRPVEASANDAATVCDAAQFSNLTDPLTRTFVVTDAGLPDTFGLTQTVGALPDDQAADDFVGTIEGRMGSCVSQDLVTDVTPIGGADFDDGRLLAWRLDVRVDEDRTVSILMGVARVGNRVTQVGFAPTGNQDVDDETFTQIVTRARERLAAAP